MSEPTRVAVVWRGDLQTRAAATPQNNRFYRVFEELNAIGICAEPAVYDEDSEDEVYEQLLRMDGVLVWVDPLHAGKTRAGLDELLRNVACRGPWVSAHPDVILKMGVKEVLYQTKHLGWGTDTHLYRSAESFQTLRIKMETEWTPGMTATLEIDEGSLPIVWDADFLYGPCTASGEDTYVLCEINVSSVFPIPDQVPAEIARLVAARTGRSSRGKQKASPDYPERLTR
jgi:hypothetical protein